MQYRMLRQLMDAPETLTTAQLKQISNEAWDQWFATGEKVQLFSDIWQLAMDETTRRWFEQAHERPVAVPPLAHRLDRMRELVYV